MNHERDRDRRNQRYRAEIAGWIVGKLLVNRGGNRLARGDAEQQGVPVGRGLRHRICAYGSAGAGPILDNKRLAQARRELVGDDAREQVGRAARRKGRDDSYRFNGIGLGVCKQRRQHQRSKGRACSSSECHWGKWRS